MMVVQKLELDLLQAVWKAVQMTVQRRYFHEVRTVQMLVDKNPSFGPDYSAVQMTGTNQSSNYCSGLGKLHLVGFQKDLMDSWRRH